MPEKSKINEAKLPPGNIGYPKPTDPKDGAPGDAKIYVKSNAGIVFDSLMLVFGILFLVLYIGLEIGLRFDTAFLILAVLIPIACGWAYILGKSYQYQLREDGVYIYHGVISRKHSLYLYAKIQDVNENQSLLHTIFGIKDLNISTMTQESQSGGKITGLHTSDASDLRSEILLRVSASTKKSGSLPSKRAADITNSPLQGAPKFTPSMKIIYPALAFSAIPIVISILLIGILGFGAIFIAFMALFFLGPVTIGLLIYKYTTYLQFDEERIYIKTGWLNVRTTTIPYDRVQDVYLSRGILDRILGLATVRALTGESMIVANQQGAAPNEIRGLEMDDAIELKKSILSKVKGDVGEEKAIADSSNYPLLSFAYLVWALKNIAVLLILAILGTFIVPAITEGVISVAIIWAFTMGVAFIVFGFAYFYYKSIDYSFTKDSIIIERGVFVFDRLTVPVKNIQDVSVHQDLIDRALGIYDVHISTITISSAALLHFDGVSKETAQGLKGLMQDLIVGKKATNKAR